MYEADGSKGKGGQQTLGFVQAYRSRQSKSQQGGLTAVLNGRVNKDWAQSPCFNQRSS